MNAPQCAAWLAAMLVLAGCQTVVPTEKRVVECRVPDPIALRKGPALVGQPYGLEMTAIPLDAVQFTNASLWEHVAVQHLSAARTPTDTVQVHARLINCTDGPIVIGVRTSFMDESQAPSEATSAWQTVHLRPRSTAQYSESSISTRVRHYLVEVRPGT